MVLLQIPRAFQTVGLMLPRPNVAYEINKTSIMRGTNEDETVSGKVNKTVMELQ